MAAATNQSRYVDHGPPLFMFGAEIAMPEAFVVGIALMVMVVELGDGLFAGIDEGLAEHVAPVNEAGTTQATVSADGNGTFGVVVKSIFTVAGVPALTVIVPGVDASWDPVMATIWNG
jgi:hypothetical protein